MKDSMSRNDPTDRSFIDIVRQAAHDLGSPLSVLNACLIGLPKLPQKKRVLFTSVIQRVQKIAEDILKAPYEHGKRKSVLHKISSHQLEQIIEEIVCEKQIEYQNFSQVKIEKRISDFGKGFEIHADENELRRVLSNLVNNAIEALVGKGQVVVSMDGVGAGSKPARNNVVNDDMIEIQIKDNGKGIPKDLLSRVTEKGQSFGKKHGYGLGLYHAKTTVESWGGHFEILSQAHRGTTIKMSFPISDYSVHSSEKVSIPSYKKGVYHG